MIKNSLFKIRVTKICGNQYDYPTENNCPINDKNTLKNIIKALIKNNEPMEILDIEAFEYDFKFKEYKSIMTFSEFKQNIKSMNKEDLCQEKE